MGDNGDLLENEEVLTVDRNNYKEILQTTRGKLVRKLRAEDDYEDSESLNFFKNLLVALLDGRSRLQTLDVITRWDLSEIDPVLISQALVKLEECRIRDYIIRPFSTDQLKSIFRAMGQDESKLRILHLPNQYFGGVPPDLLATALVKLEDTNILTTRTQFSPIQVRSLF